MSPTQAEETNTFHLVISYILWRCSNKAQSCFSNHCEADGAASCACRAKTGGACSSIKAPVNYTVPWDVSARQHPRAMTELCGFNSEHQRDVKSFECLSLSHLNRNPHVSLLSLQQRPSTSLPHWPTAPLQHLLTLLPHAPFPTQRWVQMVQPGLDLGYH